MENIIEQLVTSSQITQHIHPIVAQDTANEIGQWYIDLMYFSIWMESMVISLVFFFPFFFLLPTYTFWALIYPEFGLWMVRSSTFADFFRSAKIATWLWRVFCLVWNWDMWAESNNAWLVFFYWLTVPFNSIMGFFIILVPLMFLLGELFILWSYEYVEPFMFK